MTTYSFRSPEAARLASLGGIERDLSAVLEYCDLIPQRPEGNRGHALFEALSSAAIVRYARCFGRGRRLSLGRGYLDSASEEMRAFHDRVLALRDKHIAHSVNSFEENNVTVKVGARFQSAAEIEEIDTIQLSRGVWAYTDPQCLVRLAIWVRGKVREEKTTEQARLLPIVRRCDLSALQRDGSLASDMRGTDIEAILTTRRHP